jgi:thiamine biosynthesis lipoprotein
MGSSCELASMSVGQAELARCEREVREAEACLTRFLPDSELVRFNASNGGFVPVSALLYSMLEAALWAYQESNGLVNAAVLPALLGCGYDRPFAQGLVEPAFIDAKQLPTLPDVLVLNPRTRSAALAPGSALDLGGIAKGALADRLIAELGDDGLCNLGGDLRVRGAGPEGDGWHIALCDGTVIAVTAGAVCTSGVTRRRWGRSMHHLIDPRRGLPAVSTVGEVSVVTDTGLGGEVYAKCALLLGASDGPAFLKKRGTHFVMVVGMQPGLAPVGSLA